MSQPNCVKGERLTAPWGYIVVDMSDENSALLSIEEKTRLEQRVKALKAKRMCLEHWLAVLDLIEAFVSCPE